MRAGAHIPRQVWQPPLISDSGGEDRGLQEHVRWLASLGESGTQNSARDLTSANKEESNQNNKCPSQA